MRRIATGQRQGQAWLLLTGFLQECSVCSAVQLYKQHFASEGGDDDEDDGDGVDGEGVADLAPSANKKRLVRLQAVEHVYHTHNSLINILWLAHHSSMQGASA